MAKNDWKYGHHVTCMSPCNHSNAMEELMENIVNKLNLHTLKNKK
jgi:hypothetical protein